jgi:hypothetical protein
MTPTERDAIDIEADQIRKRWQTARQEQRWQAWQTVNKPPATPSEAFIANTKAHRQLGRDDVAHIAALSADEWGPSWLVKSREQRRTRARLIRYMRNPDPTGMMAPPDEAWAENPDLAEKFQKRLDRSSQASNAVMNPRR